MSPSGNIIYRIDGRLYLYVRTEDRGDGPEHLYVGADNRLIITRWCKHLPDEAELVHDTEARGETAVAQIEATALRQERDILNEIMAEAVKLLPDREAERLRSLFLSKMEKVEVKSR